MLQPALGAGLILLLLSLPLLFWVHSAQEKKTCHDVKSNQQENHSFSCFCSKSSLQIIETSTLNELPR